MKIIIVILFIFISLFTFSQSNNAYDIAIKKNQIGDSLFSLSEYSQSLGHYKEAYSLIESSDSISLISDVLNNIGVANDYLGVYDDAIKHYNIALDINTKYNNKVGMAMTINNIGALYFFWGKYDLALENYLESLKFDHELGNIESEAGSYENIAIIYKHENDFSKASNYFNKALQINKKLGNKNSIARNYNNIGNLQLELNDYHKAIVYHKKALAMQLKLNDLEGIMYSNNNLGSCYFKLKEYNNAEQYFIEGLRISSKQNLKVQILFSHKSLANLYAVTNNYMQSNKHLISYYELKDSIFTETKHQQIMNLEEKYQSEKRIREIELLNTKNQNQDLEIESKKSQRNLWFGISILAFIMVVISIYHYLKMRKLSEKLRQKNDLIERTLGEKDVLLREIHHRVKNNLQIITSLLNMQSKYLEDNKSKAIMEESKDRIKSMSLIHQKLYQEENITGIESRAYFQDLINSLCQSYGIDESEVELNISIDSIIMDVDTAIPLGLILNEVISNAFKYGVDKSKGKFGFTFIHSDDKKLIIKIKDNGSGIPDDFDIKKSKSYGMKLIQSLGKKLKAEIEFTNNNGLEVSLIINRYKIAS
ncbi:MAG: hypothetical protein B6I18_07935 [Bacteroidetes bacterium 4572_112]|nr:MAG: hypothetical protein B6I18_07935 [Bacteroidetes bacterium 4572_112]